MYYPRIKPTLVALGLLCVTVGCDQAEPSVAGPALPSQPQTPNEPLRVRVTGHDFRWHLRYPGPDRELDTNDDILARRHLHLPMHTPVELELRSDDYVYSLYLPEYELVEMAFPGRPFVVEISTDSAGTSRLLGSQMCGFTHPELLGDLVVQSREDFRRWLQSE